MKWLVLHTTTERSLLLTDERADELIALWEEGKSGYVVGEFATTEDDNDEKGYRLEIAARR